MRFNLIGRLGVLFGLAAALSAANAVRADIVYSGSTITENFDSLGTTNVSAAFSATVGAQSAVPGSTGFDATKTTGTSVTASTFTANDGSGTSGLMYSYGSVVATVPQTDRALGMLASGTNAFTMGFSLLNNSSTDTINSVTVSFTQENWRSSTSTSGTPNTMTAFWGTNATTGVTTANYLTNANFAAITNLDLVGPPTVTTNGALDGNNAANQVAKSFTFTGLTLAQNDRLYLRWQDVNDQGNDAGIAIDNLNLSFSVTSVPEAPAFLFGGLVCGVFGITYGGRMLRRRSTPVIEA